MKIIKKLLIVILLTLPMVVIADYLFKTLDAREGLTSSQVNCILKDSRGFMWFGTPVSTAIHSGTSRVTLKTVPL